MNQDSAELFIESDGPVPGLYSMLSIGCAAYTPEKRLVSTFSRNLETLPGAGQFPATMKFWAGNPEIWKKCRENAIPPFQAMREFHAWLEGLHGRAVFVAHPVGFDFSFVNWYLHKFLGSSPWVAGLDICSYAMGMLRIPWKMSRRDLLPKRWNDADLPHTHVALDDALGHGAFFCNMLAENLKNAQPGMA